MRKMRKVVSVLIAALLMVSMLAACSKGSNQNSGATSKPVQTNSSETTTPEETANAEDRFKDPMEISIGYWEIGSAFQQPEKDDLLQFLQKKFNITIKPRQVGWADYMEKYKVWAASGDLPDISSINIANDNRALYNSWTSQGVVRTLPDDLSQYPNLSKGLESADVQAMKTNGKFYMYPRLTYPTPDVWQGDRAILVRKDWMEKLGISDPKNFDEFSKMLKSFAEKDPDGNNKQDTVGLESHSMAHLTYLAISTLPQYATGSWLQEDGKWIPSYASKQFPEVLQQFRQLVTDNAIDKDFAILKGNEALDKFAQGHAGAFSYAVSPLNLKVLTDAWDKYNPDKKFTDNVKVLPLWPAADGNVYHFSGRTPWSESYFSKNVDDKKMDRILSLYDYLVSPEGQILTTYGIEGKDYTKDGDTFVITRPKDEKTDQPLALAVSYPSLATLGTLVTWAQEKSYVDNDINKVNFGADNLKFAIAEFDYLTTNTKPIDQNFIINSISTPAKDGLSYNVGDDVIKIMLSKEDPTKMWQDLIKGYNTKGLTEAITELNAKVAEEGIK